MTFGRWALTATAVVITLAMVEQYDARLASILAIVTLLAVWFHNRRAISEALSLLGGS